MASPILSNIYLDQLDKFVETVLIPQYTRGEHRKRNPTYVEVTKALKRARHRGDRATARQLRKQQRSLPSGDPQDPDYRRLRYARYADDQLLGFIGPKAEAEQIKTRLTTFLQNNLKLELSQEKTLITHARTGAATFLGYEIIVQHADHRRSVNGAVGLLPSTDFADDGVVHDAHAWSRASSSCWRPDHHTAGGRRQRTPGKRGRREVLPRRFRSSAPWGACGAGRLALDSRAPA